MTIRERQEKVLALSKQGYNKAQISRILKISTTTVRGDLKILDLRNRLKDCLHRVDDDVAFSLADDQVKIWKQS